MAANVAQSGLSAPAQGSEAWKILRYGNINSTDGGVIEGVNPHKKVEQFVREHVRGLAGAEPEFKGNVYTEHGIKTEPIAIEFFENEHGYIVDATGSVVHPEYSFLRGSPDGLVGLNAVIEIKCPYNEFGPAKPYSIHAPKKRMYFWQVQHMMAICDVDLCHYLCYVSPDVFIYEKVKRKPDWLEQIVAGQLMPIPQDTSVKRIELYQAWHNHIHAEFQDPEKRQKHLDDKDSCALIEDDDDLNNLAKKIERRSRLQAEIDTLAGDKITGLSTINEDIKALRENVKGKYSSNVTNGSVEVHITVKAATFNWKEAYEALGGDKALEEKSLDKSGFFNKQVKQAKIKETRT
jgi:putative phage-type endonuclease